MEKLRFYDNVHGFVEFTNKKIPLEEQKQALANFLLWKVSGVGVELLLKDFLSDVGIPVTEQIIFDFWSTIQHAARGE